jgi:hypothetical protein
VIARINGLQFFQITFGEDLKAKKVEMVIMFVCLSKNILHIEYYAKVVTRSIANGHTEKCPDIKRVYPKAFPQKQTYYKM